MAEYNSDVDEDFETPLEQKASYNTQMRPGVREDLTKRANKTPTPDIVKNDAQIKSRLDENKSMRSKRSKMSKRSRSKHHKEHRDKAQVDDFGLPISSKHGEERKFDDRQSRKEKKSRHHDRGEKDDFGDFTDGRTEHKSTHRKKTDHNDDMKSKRSRHSRKHHRDREEKNTEVDDFGIVRNKSHHKKDRRDRDGDDMNDMKSKRSKREKKSKRESKQKVNK